MKQDKTDFLVGVQGFSGEGLELLKKLYLEISDLSKVLTSSSIYRVSKVFKKSENMHDLRSVVSFDGLVAVFRGATHLTAQDLAEEFYAIEKHFQSDRLHRSAHLTLLCYGDQAVMTPRLTVPFPDLHLQPDKLMPASEVWGDYTHPVLNKKLSQLGRAFSGDSWGEFVAQGVELKEP